MTHFWYHVYTLEITIAICLLIIFSSFISFLFTLITTLLLQLCNALLSLLALFNFSSLDPIPKTFQIEIKQSSLHFFFILEIFFVYVILWAVLILTFATLFPIGKTELCFSISFALVSRIVFGNFMGFMSENWLDLIWWVSLYRQIFA